MLFVRGEDINEMGPNQEMETAIMGDARVYGS